MGKPITTNNFVTKLYQMINDQKSQHFISWTEHGTSFVVSNVGEFSRNILGSHFKHNNFSSFVRQLNMYGFHKINRTPRAQRTSSNPQIWEFSHPKFLRERPDLLEAIKRKALEPDPRERSRVELPGEVARLLTDIREENRALWREVRQLGGNIPPHIANTLGSGNSHSHTQSLSLPSNHGRGQHTLSHSRSSSNLGDDVDRDVDWEDEEPASGGPSGADVFGRLNIQTAMGALAGPSPSLHSHSPSPHPPSPSEEWRRWAETEIFRERRRVDKLVSLFRTLVEFVNPGASMNAGSGQGAGAGLGTSIGTGKGVEGSEEGKSSPAYRALTTNRLMYQYSQHYFGIFTRFRSINRPIHCRHPSPHSRRILRTCRGTHQTYSSRHRRRLQYFLRYTGLRPTHTLLLELVCRR
ncbi:HSF-type DNA-binding-domain-containing protein [Scleroderma citrinum]